MTHKKLGEGEGEGEGEASLVLFSHLMQCSQVPRGGDSDKGGGGGGGGHLSPLNEALHNFTGIPYTSQTHTVCQKPEVNYHDIIEHSIREK